MNSDVRGQLFDIDEALKAEINHHYEEMKRLRLAFNAAVNADSTGLVQATWRLLNRFDDAEDRK